MSALVHGNSSSSPSSAFRVGVLVRSFERALKHEMWGDLIEAETEYMSLERSMRSFLSGPLSFSTEILQVLTKILLSIVLRHKFLSGREVLDDSVGSAGPTTEDMKQVLVILEKIRSVEDNSELFDIVMPVFPHFVDNFRVDIIQLEEEIKNGKPREHTLVMDYGGDLEDSLPSSKLDGDVESGHRTIVLKDSSKTEKKAAGGQNLYGKFIRAEDLQHEAGKKYVSITVVKAGEKNCEKYTDPFVAMNLFDSAGNMLCGEQYTPTSRIQHSRHVHFGSVSSTFHIPLSIQELNAKNAAICFELKHYKVKKKYNSVKCWCFMEVDEIREGRIFLEWYQKPLDPLRKRIRLHTIKRLFLEIECKIR
jgi:hypothetical protein